MGKAHFQELWKEASKRDADRLKEAIHIARCSCFTPQQADRISIRLLEARRDYFSQIDTIFRHLNRKPTFGSQLAEWYERMEDARNETIFACIDLEQTYWKFIQGHYQVCTPQA